VAVAVWVFAIAYWYMPGFGGKTFFRGPQTHTRTVQVDAEGVAISEVDGSGEYGSTRSDEQVQEVTK
jgi:hypothetical protein